MRTQPTRISIRFARPADREDIHRLALLDSARGGDGEMLVAEVDGRIRAALPLGGGPVIADPFEPSAELRSLLTLRARQLAPAPAPRRPLRALAHAVPVHWRHA